MNFIGVLFEGMKIQENCFVRYSDLKTKYQKYVASGKKKIIKMQHKILSNCHIQLSFEPFHFLINSVLLRREHV